MTQKSSQSETNVSRRDFMKTSAAALSAFTIVPSSVLAGNGKTPPSEKVNLAFVGLGARGRANLNFYKDQNIVALCDVDDAKAAESYKKYPDVPKFKDFRVMLDKVKGIDGVVISTPDHNHAVIAMRAIEMGKHVYCEKPLTHSISEARMLTEAARKAGVATQMGNSAHAADGFRRICEWIWDGAIGKVREAHCWTDRPMGWPWRGEQAPQDAQPVPSTLDWDLWQAPKVRRPFNSRYLNWRAWWDFGTGAIGDMACHIVDPIFWALKLGHPETVEATCTKVSDDAGPAGSIVYYQFSARGDMPPLKLTWYSGGLKPPHPDILEEGRKLGTDSGGVLLFGDKGAFMCGAYGASPRLIPESFMQSYNQPPETLPRSPGHYIEWVMAMKGENITPGTNFDYSGPLTEMVLLGNVAIRMHGRKLNWDGGAMKVTNEPEANRYVNHHYREGWSL